MTDGRKDGVSTLFESIYQKLSIGKSEVEDGYALLAICSVAYEQLLNLHDSLSKGPPERNAEAVMKWVQLMLKGIEDVMNFDPRHLETAPAWLKRNVVESVTQAEEEETN